jgi:hypothetical protein
MPPGPRLLPQRPLTRYQDKLEFHNRESPVRRPAGRVHPINRHQWAGADCVGRDRLWSAHHGCSAHQTRNHRNHVPKQDRMPRCCSQARTLRPRDVLVGVDALSLHTSREAATNSPEQKDRIREPEGLVFNQAIRQSSDRESLCPSHPSQTNASNTRRVWKPRRS